MWVTEDEIQEYIQIDVGGNINLSNWILQGQSLIEKYINRKIEADDYIEKYDGGGRFLFLREYPVISVNYIKEDETDIDLDDVVIDKENGIILYKEKDFNEGDYNIEVSYRAGYESVPDDLKRCLAWVVQKLIGISMRGVDLPKSQSVEGTNISWNQVEVFDNNILEVLDKYRKVRV